MAGMQGLTSLLLTPLNRSVAADATPCHAVRPAASDIEAGKDALADTDALIKHRTGRFLQGFILVCLRYTGCRGTRNAGGSYRKHHRGSCWCRFGFMKTWATLPTLLDKAGMEQWALLLALKLHPLNFLLSSPCLCLWLFLSHHPSRD